MENEELRREFEELKKQNEILANMVHNKADGINAHLVFIDIVVIIMLVAMLFVAYQVYKYMPMLEGLNEKYDYINNIFSQISGYFQ